MPDSAGREREDGTRRSSYCRVAAAAATEALVGPRVAASAPSLSAAARADWLESATGSSPWPQAPGSGLRARTIAAEAWVWTR